MKNNFKYYITLLLLIMAIGTSFAQSNYTSSEKVYAANCNWQGGIHPPGNINYIEIQPRGMQNYKSNGETFFSASGKNHTDERSPFPNKNVMAIVVKIRDGNNRYFFDFIDSSLIYYEFKTNERSISFLVNDADCTDNEGYYSIGMKGYE